VIKGQRERYKEETWQGKLRETEGKNGESKKEA
jgi:hypothetical protein